MDKRMNDQTDNKIGSIIDADMRKDGLNDREYELACRHFLLHVDRIGAATAMKMVGYYGSARRIWELEEKDVWQDQGLNIRQKNNFIELRRSWDLVCQWQRLKDKGIQVVSCGERDYPGRLTEIPDKPFLLYYRGGLPEERKPCVAIVGARMCSEYGRAVAVKFAAGLAQKGIQVVSGLADGIDGIAQRSALEHGGRSYGVLGCGVDICYPLSNRTLYQELLEHGGIISEFLPGTKPEAGHFPMRNRIISGLADLILVIEAKERSGTRITVNMALEQGREVYAVPGRITDELSRGCHQMIRDGAGMALDIDEVAEAAQMAWERNCCPDWGKPKRQTFVTKLESRVDFSIEKRKAIADEIQENKKEINKRGSEKDTEGKVLQLLRKRAMNADEILYCLLAQREGLEDDVNIAMVQGTLSKLMLMGKAVCHGGLYEII